MLIACPDRPGLIAAVSGFLADAGLNITDADQHSNAEGRLFMRMVFDAPASNDRDQLRRAFFAEQVGEPLDMDYRFAESSERKAVAIMVSREDHCLSDLLWRARNGELEVEITHVISNHTGHADTVALIGADYHHVRSLRRRETTSSAGCWS